MPDYVPIQDLVITHDISDNDYFPVSDGMSTFAVTADTVKAYSASAAEAAAERKVEGFTNILKHQPIPFGKTVTYHFSDLPYFPGKLIQQSGTLIDSNVSRVVVMPMTAIKKVSLTIASDMPTYTSPFFVWLYADGTRYAYAMSGSDVSSRVGQTYSMETNRLVFAYDTMLCYNDIYNNQSYPNFPSEITIEYFTEDEWYLSTSVASETSDTANIYFGALTEFANESYMDNTGRVRSGGAWPSKVMCLSADKVDKITVRIAEAHTDSLGLPVVLVKSALGTVVQSLVTGSAVGDYTLDVDNEACKGGTIYINYINSASWLKTAPSVAIDCYIPEHMTVEWLLGNVQSYDFKGYVRRPFVFDGNVAEYIGDSITEGVIGTNPMVYTNNTWPKLFSTAVNMASYTNRAKAGACYYKPSNPSIKSLLEQLQDVNTNPGLIFIAGGTNDYVLGTSLSNFRTAVDAVITYVKQHFSSAKVIFITPINEAGWVGPPALQNIASLQAYRNIISEEVIKNDNGNFSIIQGDSFNFPTSVADSTYISAVMADHLHPTELGYATVYLTNLLRELC